MLKRSDSIQKEVKGIERVHAANCCEVAKLRRNRSYQSQQLEPPTYDSTCESIAILRIIPIIKWPNITWLTQTFKILYSCKTEPAVASHDIFPSWVPAAVTYPAGVQVKE